MAIMSAPAMRPAPEMEPATRFGSLTPSSRTFAATTMPKHSAASKSMVWYPVRKPFDSGLAS